MTSGVQGLQNILDIVTSLENLIGRPESLFNGRQFLALPGPG